MSRSRALNSEIVFGREKGRDIEQLVKGLLNKNTNIRLTSLDKIKKLSIFAGFDWLKLSLFQLDPPYKSEVADLKELLENSTHVYTEKVSKVLF